MATLDPSILKIEGGISDDVNDNGTLTKYGISQRSYPHLDIRNLTFEQALEIYRKDWWEPLRLNLVVNNGVAHQIFLLAINCGQKPAVKMIQKALNKMGGQLVVDGIIGNFTVTSINTCNNGWLSAEIRVQACKYYLDITDRDKTQVKFFRGWIRRALI